MSSIVLSMWRGLLKKPEPRVLCADVIRTVAERHGLTADDLTGPARCKRISRPRQEAMAECRRLTGASFPKIARAFRRQDHTTVMRGIRAHAERMGEGK